MHKKTLTVTFLIIFLGASLIPASLQLLADASISARGAIIAPAPPQSWNPPSAPPTPSSVWSPWHTKEQHENRMQDLCDSHSEASYEVVGTRADGSNIWLYKIGNPNGGAVLWDGALHGIEDYGSELVYLLALWLLESGDPRADAILEGNYVLFIPVVSITYERTNLNGVNLNRNFETGWRSQGAGTEEYSGPYAASELETQSLKQVFETYRPEHYVNLHQNSEWAGYYSGCPSSEVQEAISKINQVAGEFNVNPWSMQSMGSTGFAIGDAYHDGGAISWLIEVSTSWRHDVEAWNTKLVPAFWKCLVHFIAQCELCQSEQTELPPQPPPPTIEYWSVTISSQPYIGGTTSPSGSVEVEVGDTLTAQANANPDYTFEEWLFNGVAFSDDNPVTIPAQVADSTHTLEAVFAEIPPQPEPPEPPPPEPEPEPEPEPGPTSATITVDVNEIVAANRLEMGIYIGSADTGAFKSDSEFRDLAKDANVRMVAFMENRLWAVPHPCTSFPDGWNWQGMDTLIQRIFDIGAEPIIVLGFWYTSGVWTVDGYKTPTAEEWGAYCAEWVKHFKDVGLPVKYYDVGHETHQYTSSLSRLHYCIDLYVEAEKQMRAVNPNILLATDNNMDVGNSWQVANIQQEYLDKGATFDFLMWHRYVTGSMSTSTSTLIRDSEFHEGGVMGPADWIDPARQNYYNEKGVWLPVIAAGNLNWAYSGGTDPRLQDMVGGVCMALNFKLLMLKGVDCNIVYTFGGSGSSNFGIVNVNTNEPYYPYYVYKMVGPNLGKGDSIVESSSSSTDISTIAWLHDGKLNILLINKVQETQTVALNQVTGALSFWKIDNNSSSLQTGMVGASGAITMNGYTVMLLQTEISY